MPGDAVGMQGDAGGCRGVQGDATAEAEYSRPRQIIAGKGRL